MSENILSQNQATEACNNNIKRESISKEFNIQVEPIHSIYYILYIIYYIFIFIYVFIFIFINIYYHINN